VTGQRVMIDFFLAARHRRPRDHPRQRDHPRLRRDRWRWPHRLRGRQ
jgi:hypothetical protein